MQRSKDGSSIVRLKRVSLPSLADGDGGFLREAAFPLRPPNPSAALVRTGRDAVAEIVISEFMDEDVVAELAADFAVLYDPGLAHRPADLAAALGDARALVVRNRTRVDRALLDAGPRLRVIGRLGVGLDNIDLEACRERGIAVRPATGANDLAVAEYVIGTALLLLRNLTAATTRMLAGEWPRPEFVGRELAGKALGLLGFGRTARAVARRAIAFEMRVIAHDPYLPPADPSWRGVGRRSLKALLAEADLLSLHLPLTPETRGLMDASRIARMKRGAVLVNAARGGILDEAALAAALREGRLAGAALDVFEEEPLSAAAAARFRGLPNLLLTPHIAGITEESNLRVSRATAANVRQVLTSTDGG